MSQRRVAVLIDRDVALFVLHLIPSAIIDKQVDVRRRDAVQILGFDLFQFRASLLQFRLLQQIAQDKAQLPQIGQPCHRQHAVAQVHKVAPHPSGQGLFDGFALLVYFVFPGHDVVGFIRFVVDPYLPFFSHGSISRIISA